MASGELASIDSALDAIRKDVYRLSEAPMVPSSWRRLGVDVLFTNFFSEQAQLLLEARGLRGDSSLPFLSTRARQFRRRGHRLFGVGQSDFKDCQRRMTDVLGSFMQAQLGALNTDEDLALGLWLLDHERGNLHLVAASDRSHADEATLLPVPLDLSSA